MREIMQKRAEHQARRREKEALERQRKRKQKSSSSARDSAKESSTVSASSATLNKALIASLKKNSLSADRLQKRKRPRLLMKKKEEREI